MAQGIENFASPDGDGIKVIVKAGMSQREIEFPDATSYVENGNELRVGAGDPNTHHNYLRGETLGVFNWANVVCVVPM